ncbi:GNAT family N-acetyltransferase [Pandoraea pnomenusa]|uniref:GNAT family N-acetyltransferase n=1 Tax=Pandoraea pnomenusa TaxID=93220 RepID=UPI003341B250
MTTSPEPLDNPPWHALSGRHANLAQGAAGLALRYRPDVAAFAAVKHMTQDAFDALATLIPAGDFVWLMSLAPIPAMDRVHGDVLFSVCQMVDTARVDAAPDDGVLRLSKDDVPDMMSLADKTRPGPFSRSTIEMGNYVGIRDGGELIAMAGERMCLDGYVEISAVCVDERHRGRGLAQRLMNILRKEIRARGDVPFLHVRDDNASAIRLYERMGFETRQVLLLNRVAHRQLY